MFNLDFIIDTLGWVMFFGIVALISWFITTAIYAFCEGFIKGYNEGMNKRK